MRKMSAKVRIQPVLPLKRPIREGEDPQPFREPSSRRSHDRSSSLEGQAKSARKRSLPNSDAPEPDQRKSKRVRKEKKKKSKKEQKEKKKKKKKKHHKKKTSKSGKREKNEDHSAAAAPAPASEGPEAKAAVVGSEQPTATLPKVAPPKVVPALAGPAEPKEGEECYAESDTDSELNLDRPLLRIQDYFDDKREMCHQMFQTLQGRKLRSMIPEVLRGCSLIEVRNMCRKELEGMSRKRVLRILKGDDPKTISSSSSSGGNSSGLTSRTSKTSSSSSSRDSSPSASYSSSSSSSSCSSSFTRTRHRHAHKRRHREKKSLEPVVDSTCKLESPPQDEKKEAPPGAPEEPPVEQDLLVVSAADLDDDLEFARETPAPLPAAPAASAEAPAAATTTSPVTENASTTPAAPTTATTGPLAATTDSAGARPLTRTQLEIAELEMRARAIRAMLKAQEKKDPRIRMLRK